MDDVGGQLHLEQRFQTVTGWLAAGGQTVPIEEGGLSGSIFTFRAAGTDYRPRSTTRRCVASPAGTTTPVRGSRSVCSDPIAMSLSPGVRLERHILVHDADRRRRVGSAVRLRPLVAQTAHPRCPCRDRRPGGRRRS